MNASEARELTKKYIRKDLNDIIESIESYIMSSVEVGLTVTSYKFEANISYLKIKKLYYYFTLEGYSVEIHQPNDGQIYYNLSIEWK